MPLYFDNSTAAYSEATRTFDSPQDWTQWHQRAVTVVPRRPGNRPAVVREGQRHQGAYDGDAANMLRRPWQMWYIDLSA